MNSLFRGGYGGLFSYRMLGPIVSGLGGLSPWSNTQVVTPPTIAIPVYNAMGELRMLPCAPGTAPPERRRRCFPAGESCRVVSWPCETVVVFPWASVTRRSPLFAAI